MISGATLMIISAVGVVDTIEANVTVAHDQVGEGHEQLVKAAAYQASWTFITS